MLKKYELSQREVIASGGEKLVYEHPDNCELLIKVWRDRYLTNLKKKHRFLFHYFRTPRYSALLNELIEHIAVRENGDNTSYLQNIFGLVDTDLGVGLVVESVKDEEGCLAKSVYQLIASGRFHHQQSLEDLLAWLSSSHVIVRDFTLNNVVWDGVNNRFVIIDGIGSRPVPSLRMFSKKYNRYSMNKKILKFRVRLDNAIKEFNKAR